MVTTLVFDFIGVIYLKKESSFFGDYELNEELLNFLAKAKEKFKLYVLTSSLLIDRTQVHTQLKQIFTDVISARKLGLEKYDPKTYRIIAQDHLHADPKEIFFTDDHRVNVDAAKKIGIDARVFRGNKETISLIRKLNKK